LGCRFNDGIFVDSFSVAEEVVYSAEGRRVLVYLPRRFRAHLVQPSVALERHLFVAVVGVDAEETPDAELYPAVDEDDLVKDAVR